MTSDASKAFRHVRPYCVEFMQKRDLISLEKLHDRLKALDKDALEEISLYILFPFRVMIKRSEVKSEEFLIKSLDCISYIFSSVAIEDWDVVSEFLGQLCGLISSPADKDLEAFGSEELKRGVAEAIGALVDHASSSVRNSVYKPSNVPLLGHVVTLLLSIARSNIDKQGRVVALNVLRSLCNPSYCALLEESAQNALKSVIGDCMACFLPGVSTVLSKIIATDSNAGHKVKSQSMEVLSTFIVVTLADQSPKSNNASSDVNPKLRSLIVKRDDKWVAMVTEKLTAVVENVCSASNSTAWSVRLSCVEFCGKILLQCQQSLKNLANMILRVLVKLMNDDYKQIQHRSSRILDQYSSCLQEEESGSRVLAEILEENLFSLCSALPRLMRTTQDAEKMSSLRILLGYLTLLKRRIKNLLYSQPHLAKLSSALLHCLELDSSSIQFMDVTSSSIQDSYFDKDDLATRSCFRKEFCHFRDDEVYTILCRICNTLGRFGDLDLLVDYYLEVYMTSQTHCKQAVMILNKILLGTESSDRNNRAEKLHASVKTLLNEYLSPENWYLVTNFESEYFQSHHNLRMQKFQNSDQNMAVMLTGSASSYEETTLKMLKNNTILCCLHVESILIFSKVLKMGFRTFLMHSLYPLLEKTTDPDSSIASCAIRAMHGVAQNCGYRNASDLIAENADYLISDISIQIHRLEMFPRCPAVLQAMLDHSHSDILALVSDTVDEILMALDLHHLDPGKLLVFVPALLSVPKAINRWITNKNDDDFEPSSLKKEDCKMDSTSGEEDASSSTKDSTFSKRSGCIENLRNHLLDLQKNKKIASLEMDAEIDPQWKPGDEEDAQYQHPIEEEEKKSPPKEIQVITKILSRCIHLMAHSDPRLRMRIMDVVETGMLVLKTHENELLPMVHKIWSPLVARFEDKELQVVMKAFDTVCSIASCSKDFLRKRFGKEILPKILGVLQAQAKNSANVSKKRPKDTTVFLPNFRPADQKTVAFTHSVAFKLQKRALAGLGPLLRDLDVQRPDHILVCRACTPYLSSKQPGPLQEVAMALFRHLTEINPDLTWLQLTGTWCPISKLEPSEEARSLPIAGSLRTVFLGGNTDPQSEFANNIQKLLREFLPRGFPQMQQL